jgi:hypothetical protein
MEKIQRTLLKSNGKPRIAVAAVLREYKEPGVGIPNTGTKVMQAVTDQYGRFSFDVSDLPTGIYQLEYYGDKIIPTEYGTNLNLIREDPYTPWEFEIEIIRMEAEFDKIPPDHTVADEVYIEE